LKCGSKLGPLRIICFRHGAITIVKLISILPFPVLHSSKIKRTHQFSHLLPLFKQCGLRVQLNFTACLQSGRRFGVGFLLGERKRSPKWGTTRLTELNPERFIITETEETVTIVPKASSDHSCYDEMSSSLPLRTAPQPPS
jgi:hypothetical protein